MRKRKTAWPGFPMVKFFISWVSGRVHLLIVGLEGRGRGGRNYPPLETSYTGLLTHFALLATVNIIRKRVQDKESAKVITPFLCRLIFIFLCIVLNKRYMAFLKSNKDDCIPVAGLRVNSPALIRANSRSYGVSLLLGS